MRFRLPNLRLLTPVILLGALLGVLFAPLAATAQDDGDSTSLGDFARNLRKQKLRQPDAAPPIIDNDNLDRVIEDTQRARPIDPDKTVFSIDPRTDKVKVSSPDVTCSLSFNARDSSLLIKPVLIEDLPLTELLKLDGPGFIQDENLQMELFNGSDWDLREITIGLTLERKPGENAELAASAHVIPAAQDDAAAAVERRSDVTLLYHLKAEAKPFSTTSFRENIGITPGPDEDWRWSVVEAKGIRPSEATALPDSLQEPLFASPPFLPGQDNPQVAAPAPITPARVAPDKVSPANQFPMSTSPAATETSPSDSVSTPPR